VEKFASPYPVIPAGSAGIQCQGWQKQQGFEIMRSHNHANLDLTTTQGKMIRSLQPSADYADSHRLKTQQSVTIRVICDKKEHVRSCLVKMDPSVVLRYTVLFPLGVFLRVLTQHLKFPSNVKQLRIALNRTASDLLRPICVHCFNNFSARSAS